MEMARALVVLENNGKTVHVDATRIRFSAHQCFAFDGGEADLRVLRILGDHLALQPGLAAAIEGDGEFLKYLLFHCPHLRDYIGSILVRRIPQDGLSELCGIPVVLAAEMPDSIQTVFLCETRTYPRWQMRRWLENSVRMIDPDILVDLALAELPARAWVPWARDTIYPVDLPEIEFEQGLDAILIDCPARNLGLMPNGLGYVHNALKQVPVSYQTLDLDILIYHRFHVRRLFDEGGKIVLASGRELPTDPWQAEHYDLWSDAEVLAYFEPEVQEIVDKLAAAAPKVLGLSIHACNEKFSAAVVGRLKAMFPEIVILVGGFSCYSADIGLRGFPLADYMCIGEADLTVGPLVERLARGERPANTPGVLSRHDKAEVPFVPGPMVHELDLLEHPRYEWYDLDIYRNYNGYQLTPIIASRGCRWSRCTFCAERFYWRIRSPEAFVDEVEWLVSQGCRLFMFNESDLNGRPETLLAICDEVIRRGLKIKLTGQLRIHRKCDRAYFHKLRAAGFVALRFGVDAFSENALRLQKKGYTVENVSQNLKDCWEAGIYTEVNWVIGVPGETEQDIDEGIDLILKNKPYIGRLANVNPLILTTGSVYWLEPEKHNIHFRGDKDELYRNHPRAIPAHLWYSTGPYIDEKVRKARFERIVLDLHRANFGVGAWAERVIEDVKKNRDSVRVGPAEKTDEEPTTTPEPKRAKLSAGVGRMKTDEKGSDGARTGSVAFRAGSALPEDCVHYFRSDLFVISVGGELLGIEGKDFRAALPSERWRPEHTNLRTIDVRGDFSVRHIKSKAAVPELLHSVGTYNVVHYDARYYGLPQNLGPEVWQRIRQQLQENGFRPRPGVAGLGTRLKAIARWLNRKARGVAKRVLVLLGLRQRTPPPPQWPDLPTAGPVPWGEVDVAGLPGVFSSENLATVLARVEAAQGLPRRAPIVTRGRIGAMAPNAQGRVPLLTLESSAAVSPRLVGSIDDFNIVEYQGWFYGLPRGLGDIHLDQVDVLETSGVIRDLSRDVVEGEIREIMRSRVQS